MGTVLEHDTTCMQGLVASQCRPWWAFRDVSRGFLSTRRIRPQQHRAEGHSRVNIMRGWAVRRDCLVTHVQWNLEGMTRRVSSFNLVVTLDMIGVGARRCQACSRLIRVRYCISGSTRLLLGSTGRADPNPFALDPVPFLQIPLFPFFPAAETRRERLSCDLLSNSILSKSAST